MHGVGLGRGGRGGGRDGSNGVLSLSFDALPNFKILTWQNKIPHQHVSL